LDRIHPQVPDSLRLARELPVSTEKRRTIERILRDLLRFVPQVYGTLPTQMIHGDFGWGNVLFLNDRLTGILDIEFTTRDLRAMDFASGVNSFGMSGAEARMSLETVAAFARGYARRGQLTHEEIAALPMLLRLRAAAILLHWSGRWKEGRMSERMLQGQVTEVLASDDWLTGHQEDLLVTVRGAMG
jgi:homoserine kinase type II